MNYIETAKTIILTLLVLLSVAFTFSIWTYSPSYDTIDQLSAVDISIAEKRTPEQLIKPYKMVMKYGDDQMKGTVDQHRITQVLNEMAHWKVTEFVQVQIDQKETDLQKLMEGSQRYMLYYDGEVPIAVFEKFLRFEDTYLPELTFDRLIVTWDASKTRFQLHFVNRLEGIHFRGSVTAKNRVTAFETNVLNEETFINYEQIETEGNQFLAVPNELVKAHYLTFYQEEVSPQKFRNALFSDPNAVRRSQIANHMEEYVDNHARMQVNTEKKLFTFVHPTMESHQPAIPSELLLYVIEAINEHGGWTDDYRFSYIRPFSRYVKFQLYMEGLPVHSESPSSSEMLMIYGDSRVYQYIRPYFTFDQPITKDEWTLPAGTDVIRDLLEKEENLDIASIEELTLGYTMQQDVSQNLTMMEPTWFYLIKGNWFQYSSDIGGGKRIGLE